MKKKQKSTYTKTLFTTKNKMELPISFETVDQIEALILTGISLDEPINRKQFVLSLTEMCKETFEDNVEIVFNSEFELFFMLSQEIILKIEYDFEGILFVPIFPVSSIEHWLSCWNYDIRLIYFIGIVLKVVEKIGFNPDGTKKENKQDK